MALRRSGSTEHHEGARIDLSPMIDCVFILLIFFIVTTVFIDEIGISVNSPDGPTSDLPLKDIPMIELEITASGAVKFNQRNIEVDGVTAFIKKMMKGNPEIPVLIKADKNTPHQLFAKVYGSAKLAGAQKISFQ